MQKSLMYKCYMKRD